MIYILRLKMILLTLIIILISATQLSSIGSIIPTDSEQQDFPNTYKFVLYKSYADMRFTGNNLDDALFPLFGEFSIYWANSGDNKGSFILPETVPSNYSGISNNTYTNYNWNSVNHYSIQYKPHPKRIAIFRSKIKHNNNTVSWGAIYYKNMFDSYLFDNIYYFVDEDYLDSNYLDGNTQLLIIPPFTLKDDDNEYYIDQVFDICPNIKSRLDNYLSKGGMIYAEGNSAYFIEKLNYLDKGAVDFGDYEEADHVTNLVGVDFLNSKNPVSFTESATGEYLWTTSIPKVKLEKGEIFAKTKIHNYPASFLLKGADANGGKILCNLGLPTIGGMKEIGQGSRQLQWTLNSILFTFAKNIDVNRYIWNELPDSMTAGKNAVSYDRLDTFEVKILVRNLSDKPIDNISITEYITAYFKFVEVVTPGIPNSISSNTLKLSGISLDALEEKVIIYKLMTPLPDDKIHEEVDKYIAYQNYIYASYGVVNWEESAEKNIFWKYRNYVDIMFSAFLVADTDLNWKNFLYLDYQPFKVFMIMENKERTPAVETKYEQYIPKDVPFYWTDNSINIPILKTPGGKFVDVLKGSNDQDNPEFDMDSDGNPDVWLDTATIYPKGFVITEEEVYWLNPWEHLRTDNHFLYEDINHDGKRAEDTNGDGIVDIEAPGDKIRVWKLTWNLDKIAGYDYFDPYCSYEIWVDPPDLVPLSAGVGSVNGKLNNYKLGNEFYPYTPDISTSDIKDTTWSHWMERDKNGNIIWKQLIFQKIDNYEGFTFIDTTATGYKLKPTDYCAGTVPQPHREFIAVLSLGGEEIDMEHYRPSVSRYSNLKYKTIFGEERVCPIRSTYTYYAPLPNPLQFEYLTNCYTITNPVGDTLKYLPAWGKANLTFDIDASTEYTYYWIRGAGHDVDYNDPSEAIEGVEELGDGVFGYMVYDIPKGMGGYKITLPKNADGTYDIDNIVEVDGQSYKKWLENPNTKNDIEIYEDPYQYHVHIPQLLIPPALDDDNFDGIDDWIDDRGDRFQSKTGYLHDLFMLDNGEDWPDYPVEPFKDDIYGMVTSGWYHGADGTYGDDFFENLGKTHFKIKAEYEGLGKEGPVDISKGGWLVVEEIFGGSPWVIFSHVLSGFAEGVDYKLEAKANPSVIKYGLDTCYIKYSVKDEGEPHNYDINFDPYHVSYGYGETTITTYSGGKDPCSLISPSFNMSTIIDVDFDKRNDVVLIPFADKSNPELSEYPKTVSGCFLEIKIEVMNGTDDNWVNTQITPNLPSGLKNSSIVMSYVAYPRPLVPAKFDPVSGEIIQGGDDIGAFKAGWRFNQPEGEVLVKIGNTLPLMQPSRRAYFVFLIKIDESLVNGTYDITFNISGERRHYDEGTYGKKKEQIQRSPLNYEVPPLKFAVSDRDAKGNVKEYQKFIIGNADLKELLVTTTENFRGLEDVRWSKKDINHLNFDSILTKLPSTYDENNGIETIDMSSFRNFPSADLSTFYILQKGEVYSYGEEEDLDLTVGEELKYNSHEFGDYSTEGVKVVASTIGPKLNNFKKINTINGKIPKKDEIMVYEKGIAKDIESMVQITNYGNDIAQNTVLEMSIGTYFKPILDKLPADCRIENEKIIANMGACLPGEKKQLFLHFTEKEGVCECMFDTGAVIPDVQISYIGNFGMPVSQPSVFSYKDEETLDLKAPDLNLSEIKSSVNKLKYNSDVTITAMLQNGITKAENVELNIYARTNVAEDILVSSQIYETLEEMEKVSYSAVFHVNDTLEYIEFYASAKSSHAGVEFCEQNNSKLIQIPFEGPNWIIDVKNYPNPITYKTYVSYYLPRELKELNLLIYSFDGQEVHSQMDCPVSLGHNTILWLCPNESKGTYIFKFEGIDEKGEKQIFNGRFVKD